MEIYLIRHEETILGKEYCYGHYNIPLKKPFRNNHKRIVDHLKIKDYTLYASPLDRCLELANQFKISNRFIEDVVIDNRLIELNFGEWEMKKWDEINQEKLNIWISDLENTKVPGGESFKELHKRTKKFLDELIKTNSTNAVVITHAGVIRSMLCHILEMPLRNAFKIPIDFGSITKICIDTEYSYQRIGFINQTLEVNK